MAWVNIAASTSLVNEFNLISPSRDKASDGSIGDGEHAVGISDHNPDETGNTGGIEDADSINEVHARDVDVTGPWPAGWSMERFVQLLLARCRSGAETRLRYIIYNQRIWSASTGWAQRPYHGANPHDRHAHFSFRYGSGANNPEDNTTSWGMLAAVQKGTDMSTPKELLDFDDVPNLYSDKVTNKNVTVRAALKAAVSTDVKIDQVLAQMKLLLNKDFTDEPAIIAGVLAGLDPAAIAAAIPAELAQQVANELATRLAA